MSPRMNSMERRQKRQMKKMMRGGADRWMMRRSPAHH